MIDCHCTSLFNKRFKQYFSCVLKFGFLVVLGLMMGHAASAQDQIPWNRLYVTNFASNTVSVVDLNLSKVVAEIPVGLGPTGMAVTPDVEYVYVANLWSGDISVISTASNSVLTTIAIPGYQGKGAPFGIAMTPDGSQVFVTDLSDGTIRVISTQTNTITATITGAYDWALRYIAVSPDGQYAYAVGTGEGKITVIRVFDFAIVGRITNLPSVRHLAVTPDGSRLYATSEKFSRLYVIDAATYGLITTIQFPAGAGTITVDIEQAGKFAMVANYQEKLSVIDTDPRSPTYNRIIGQVPPNSGYQYCIVVSPDGRFAYLSNQSDRGKSPNSINIIDIAPGSPTRYTIIGSIPVGKQPWGVAIVKQPQNIKREIEDRSPLRRPGGARRIATP